MVAIVALFNRFFREDAGQMYGNHAKSTRWKRRVGQPSDESLRWKPG
jgi:hypothetical protein